MRSPGERVDPGVSPARSMPQWLKGRSACVVNRRMPVRFRPAAHGRVAQRTEHLTSKERDAGSTPAASAPLSSTGEDGFSRRSRRRFDSVRGHRWACGVMDSTRAFEARRSGFESSHARRSILATKLPYTPCPLGSVRNDANGIVEPGGTSRVPTAASGITRRQCRDDTLSTGSGCRWFWNSSGGRRHPRRPPAPVLACDRTAPWGSGQSHRTLNPESPVRIGAGLWHGRPRKRRRTTTRPRRSRDPP